VAGLVLWVIIEYIVGKRNDVAELISAFAFLVFLIVTNLHLSQLEILKDQNELHLLGWFGVRRKVIK
jgi:hypothetical protein